MTERNGDIPDPNPAEFDADRLAWDRRWELGQGMTFSSMAAAAGAAETAMIIVSGNQADEREKLAGELASQPPGTAKAQALQQQLVRSEQDAISGGAVEIMGVITVVLVALATRGFYRFGKTSRRFDDAGVPRPSIIPT